MSNLDQHWVADVTALAEATSPLSALFTNRGFKITRCSFEVVSVDAEQRRYRVRRVPSETEPNTWEEQFTPLDANGFPQ